MDDGSIYRWLRITAASRRYTRRCVIGKYIRTCNLLSVLTRNSLTIESSLAWRRERSSAEAPFLCSRVYGQFSRPFSLSSLFYTSVPLFLTFLVPHRVLSFSHSTYIIRTTRRQSVQRHRCQHLVRLTFLSSFLSFPSIFLSYSPVFFYPLFFSLFSPVTFIHFVFSYNKRARYHLHRGDQRPLHGVDVPFKHLYSLTRFKSTSRSKSSFIPFSAREEMPRKIARRLWCDNVSVCLCPTIKASLPIWHLW